MIHDGFASFPEGSLDFPGPRGEEPSVSWPLSLDDFPAFPHLHRPDLGKPMGQTHVKGTLMTRFPCQTEGCDHILERRT